MSGDSKTADTVPGLGFKDKEKALETLKNLEGRDPDYQKLAIKGLIGRAKRTLTVTKAEDKLTNIKEALEVFEHWLKDFEKLNLSNYTYLPLASVETFIPLKNHFEITDKKLSSFLNAYREAEGDYKRLRTIASGDNEPTWDIVRNTKLKSLLKTLENDKSELWDDSNDGLPTKTHTELILWAYSPEASKIKKNLSKFQESLEKYGDEEKSDEEGNEDDDDDEDEEEEKEKSSKKSSKRKSSANSDSEESPEKKRAAEKE